MLGYSRPCLHKQRSILTIVQDSRCFNIFEITDVTDEAVVKCLHHQFLWRAVCDHTTGGGCLRHVDSDWLAIKNGLPMKLSMQLIARFLVKGYRHN